MRRTNRFWAVVAVCALIVGLVLVVVAVRRDGGPPEPDSDGTSTSRVQAAAPLSRSAPTRIRIPAIGVDASVLSLGLNPDGTVQEPSLTQPELTSWFNGGPAPGEPGPAAFYGHVDTRRSGPAVFYRLGRLKEGDSIRVTRRDGNTAVFRVDSVEQVPKAEFPTARVYGSVPEPVIRLMTCGGDFDPAKRSYRDNIIVFGTLVDSLP